MSNPPLAPQQQRNIQAIPTASVAKICSGQVILDLSMAVKELLENALDAGATSVEIRLREHGLALIEVADNGKGVPPEDHAALALKYHTSKINQFQDLEALHTFGFRGEALSSLAALGQLSVITRTAQQAAATRLEYDSNGVLTSSTPVARAVGTTVALKDLFEPLPVRRQEFTRNVRREVAKLKLLLQQYAILSTQAQLFASDQSGKSARTVLVSTGNAGATLLERVSAVLGSKVSSVLVPLEVKLQKEGVTITGLVSRAGCGVKGDKLRQFCCINGRPVELTRAIKTLNDTYKSLYSSLVGLRPMAFLCFELPPGSFDVNVTPDKRSVFVQREVALVNALGQALQALWEPSRYSYAVNTTQAAFDSQRQPQPPTPAAAAAAAAAGGGEQLDGPGADHHQQQQHDALAEETAAAEAEGSEEEVQDEGTAAAGSSSRAAVVDPSGGPPSLASFMIAGGPAGAAAAAGQKRLRPLEAALLGRKVPRQQLGSGSVSGATSTTAAAAAAAADSSLDVLAAAGSEDESEEEEEEEEEEATADTTAAAAIDAAAAAGPGTGLRRQQRQQGVPLPLASFQLGGSSSEQPVATQTAGAGLAATHLEEQSQSAAAAATGGRRGGGAAAAAGQASLAAFGFKVLQGGCYQQQQQRGGAASTQEESGDELDGQEAAEQQQQQQQQLSAPFGGAGAGAVEVVDMCGSEEQGGLVEEGTETEEGDIKPQQQQQQAGGSGEEEEGEVVVVGEQQQQQQQGRAGGDRHQQRQQQRQRPLVVDYSMQQLVADVEAQLQQLRVQQQQEQEQEQGLQGEGHTGQHPGLAAASLQGQDTSGSQDAPAAAEAGGTTAAAAAAAGSTDAATDELMRVFNKADFAAMSAVGQFNLGFIIARLRGDLFIVDQHAADEKSTFERLMGSFAVNRQPLLQPRRLATLTPMDQQTIRENIDIFRRNGFDFVDRDLQPAAGGQQGTHRQQQQGASSDQQHQQRLWSKPPRSKAAAAAAAAGDAAAAAASTGRDGCGGDSQQQQQQQQEQIQQPLEEEQASGFGVDVDAEGCGRSELLLSMVPVLKSGASGGGALGEEVLLELLDLIAAGETRPEDIRPKKVRDVLASRACRTSVMIGSPLSRQQQGRILARLAQLDAPFNCPHGRPTMRHLAVLPAEEGPPARQQPV